jgi:hypothetical protein
MSDYYDKQLRFALLDVRGRCTSEPSEWRGFSIVHLDDGLGPCQVPTESAYRKLSALETQVRQAGGHFIAAADARRVLEKLPHAPPQARDDGSRFRVASGRITGVRRDGADAPRPAPQQRRDFSNIPSPSIDEARRKIDRYGL